MQSVHQLYLLYADLLDYPSPNLVRQADECAKLLEHVQPTTSELFYGFLEWAKREPLPQAEEIYTSAFDLQGICCPYVGHHLFGDNYQRSWFMARLKGQFTDRGFSCGKELPDHVTAILRFLALGDEDEFSQVLLDEGLLPAVEKMILSFSECSQHPYGLALKSLITLLKAGKEAGKAELAPTVPGGLIND